MMKAKRLILVIFEDEDVGCVWGYFPNVKEYPAIYVTNQEQVAHCKGFLHYPALC